MTTSAEIICDSLAPSGIRLTTFVLNFPRFILPEFNTHRVFSRNASSSRAIPIQTQIKEILNNPFVPKSFNVNAKGMQGGDVVDEKTQKESEKIWLSARFDAVLKANELLKLGISKQYVNRLLEPFSWTKVVCSSTEFNNFFALRYHHMAQPEICELAKVMYEAYSTSTPKKLNFEEWHLPFIKDKDWNEARDIAGEVKSDVLDLLLARSVARCARTSYNNHDGTSNTFSQDLALYERLLKDTPKHCSPAEHQAQAIMNPEYKSGNFTGWCQYRQSLKEQNITRFEGPLK